MAKLTTTFKTHWKLRLEHSRPKLSILHFKAVDLLLSMSMGEPATKTSVLWR